MRVLVVHASSRGGTAGLAELVAGGFIEHGIPADVGATSAVDALDGYDAVIVGGALYNGRWHSDASSFVERNLDALLATDVWFFSSGPLDDSARSGALAPVPQVQELARRAEIHGHMTFGGVLESKPTFLSSLLAWGKPGDYRDPQQVAEWVERIAARLAEPSQRRQPRPPQRAIVLPDADRGAAEPGEERVATRVFRRLVAAGDPIDDGGEDLGLDVLAELSDN